MALEVQERQEQVAPAEPENEPQADAQGVQLPPPTEANVTTRPSTLGGQYWFDVPTMLAMLILGALALSFAQTSFSSWQQHITRPRHLRPFRRSSLAY